jgi:predicted polyphosphate/ATP-dependent NAD kinase
LGQLRKQVSPKPKKRPCRELYKVKEELPLLCISIGTTLHMFAIYVRKETIAIAGVELRFQRK